MNNATPDQVAVEVQAIIECVTAAFRDVPRGPRSLHQAIIAKWAEPTALQDAAACDADHHWSEIPDDVLQHGGKALYADEPRSWLYLIPAFMVWTLRNFHMSDSFVVDQTIYAFVPSRDSSARFELLSPEQCRAVCRFLSFMSQQGDRVDAEVARKALSVHWGRFCGVMDGPGPSRETGNFPSHRAPSE